MYDRVPPIARSTLSRNVTPDAASMTTLVAPPESVVLRVPVEEPCVTVTPAVSAMTGAFNTTNVRKQIEFFKKLNSSQQVFS